MSKNRTFIIVGASQAGGWIAKTLRNEGFDGKVVLIGEEPYLPYERPPLSKDALLGKTDLESTFFWKPETYENDRIDVLLNTRVTEIKRDSQSIICANGDALHYDKLAITTGARVRRIPIPGADLLGVHYLRNMDDTHAIRRDAEKKGTAIIIGGGWIGLECAATLDLLGCKPIVVESSERLCGRAVTPDISDWMLSFHRNKGVDVRLNMGVERLEGDKILQKAILSDGTEINCSIAVVGIGVIPNVELATDSGIEVDNGIVVDNLSRTSDPNIFSAGDVANHPNQTLGRRIRLESWENAMNQGINTGKAMLDKGEPYNEIPWFWSDQFDANIQMIGLPTEWDETAIRGNKSENEFVEFYLKNEFIVGAVSVNSTRDLRFGKRLMQAKKNVQVTQLENTDIKMQSLLKG